MVIEICKRALGMWMRDLADKLDPPQIDLRSVSRQEAVTSASPLVEPVKRPPNASNRPIPPLRGSIKSRQG